MTLRPWRPGQSGNPLGGRVGWAALLREVGRPPAPTPWAHAGQGLALPPVQPESSAAVVGYVDLQGQAMIPRIVLTALATAVRLTSVEARVLLLVLAAPAPLTVFTLAKRLRLPYTNAKRTVRALVRWQILDRLPEGVRLQPDAARWGPPTGRPPLVKPVRIPGTS